MHEWLQCVCIQNLNWNCHHHHISASSSSSSCNGIISSFRIMMMLSTAHQLSLAASKTLKDKCFRERETKESLIKTIVIAIFYINLWGGEKPSSPIVSVLTTWLLRMECHSDHVGDDDDDKDDWWWWWLVFGLKNTSSYHVEIIKTPVFKLLAKVLNKGLVYSTFKKKRQISVIKVKHSQLSFGHCNCNQCQEHHFMGNKVCVWAIVHSKYGN